MRAIGLGCIFVAALGLFSACSGSGNGGGSGGTGYTPNPQLCQSYCDAGAKAGCNTGPAAECQAGCEEDRQKYAQCLAETDALMSCSVQSGFVCLPGGGASINGCEAEINALSICGACMPVGSDSACDVCAKKGCCSEYKAFGAASDFADYKKCALSCGSVTCLDGCAQQFPVSGQAFKAVEACRSAQCPSACDGVPSTTDPVGRYCDAAKKAGCPMADCESSFDFDDPFGCGLEFYAAIECAAAKPVTCVDGQPQFDESCYQPWMDCAGVGGGGGAGGVGTDAGIYGGAGGSIIGGAGGTGGIPIGGAGGIPIGGAGGTGGADAG